jgi:hypothetical protein
MLRSTLVAIAAVLTLATPTASATPAATSPSGPAPVSSARDGITGTWKGQVRNQDGPAGYSGTVRLTRSGGKYRATVSYSNDVAATKWIFEGRKAGWFRFREIPRSSTDDGVSGTEIKVKRVGAKLAVRYYVREVDYRGSMTAHRLR